MEWLVWLHPLPDARQALGRQRQRVQHPRPPGSPTHGGGRRVTLASTPLLWPCLLNWMASYDVDFLSDICQAPSRHLIDTDFAPSFVELNGIV